VTQVSRAIVRSVAAGLALGLVLWSSSALSRSTSSASASATSSSLTVACGVVPGTQFRVISRTETCVITLAVRHSFSLSLSSGFRWSGLHASSPALVQSASSGPPNGGLTSLITAKKVGRVTLQAMGVMVCAPGVACPELARLWSLVVLVSAKPSEPIVLALTIADGGRQYSLRTGDQLSMNLVGPSAYVWNPVVSSAPRVLRVISTGGGSVAVASLVARGPGRSHVSAIDNPRCYPQCLAPSRIFQVGVLVSR
jgi:hypothetical protein